MNYGCIAHHQTGQKRKKKRKKDLDISKKRLRNTPKKLKMIQNIPVYTQKRPVKKFALPFGVNWV